jgi:cobalt-zinc-cadmium efflux system outer membrane protein
MNPRIVPGVVVAALAIGPSAFAQAAALAPQGIPSFVDPARGLSLEQAIATALAQEPSLQAARSQVDVARGLRQQASAQPNPMVSFEWREEPGGTDHLRSIGLEWPLGLFRRGGREAVADRETEAAQFAASDRERLLASDVRTRYGDVAARARDLSLMEEIIGATRKQFELLRSRADQGATPPLERDLLDVELRRLESQRLMQAGDAEAALIALKRALGMKPDAALTLRDSLEALIQAGPPAPAADAAAVIDGRADVKEAEARVAAAEARIERAEGQGRFDVSVFASYMRMDAGFPQQGFAADGSLERIRAQFNYVSAGASITIPVLNRSQGDVAAARAERTGAAAAAEAVRLSAETELAGARARDARARQAARIYADGARALARQNLAVVAQSYELGRVTVFEVLAEQRRYLDVERAYTDALRAAFEAQTAVQRARGDLR